MANFSSAFRKTMGHEGGYSNNPADRGGETYRGISRKHHPDWDGWPIVDSYKSQPDFPRNLTTDPLLPDKVVHFYHDEYWMKIGGTELSSQSLAEELFDNAVNMGIGQSARFLQQAVNLLNRNQDLYPNITVDGDIGPTTLGAVRQCIATRSERTLINVTNLLQGCFYIELMKNDESQEEFALGWVNRVEVKHA